MVKPMSINEAIQSDAGLRAMRKEYFALIKREDIGKTPAITKEADELEHAIRERAETLIAP